MVTKKEKRKKQRKKQEKNSKRKDEIIDVPKREAEKRDLPERKDDENSGIYERKDENRGIYKRKEEKRSASEEKGEERYVPATKDEKKDVRARKDEVEEKLKQFLRQERSDFTTKLTLYGNLLDKLYAVKAISKRLFEKIKAAGTVKEKGDVLLDYFEKQPREQIIFFLRCLKDDESERGAAELLFRKLEPDVKRLIYNTGDVDYFEEEKNKKHYADKKVTCRPKDETYFDQTEDSSAPGLKNADSKEGLKATKQFAHISGSQNNAEPGEAARFPVTKGFPWEKIMLLCLCLLLAFITGHYIPSKEDKRQIQNYNEIKRSLQTEIEHLRKESSISDDAKRRLEEKYDALKKESGTCDITKRRLEEKNEELKKESGTCDVTKRRLEEKNEELKKESGTCDVTKRRLEEKNEEMRKECWACENAKRQLEERHERLKEKSETYYSENKWLKENNVRLKEKYEDVKDENISFKQQNEGWYRIVMAGLLVMGMLIIALSLRRGAK